MTLPFWCELFPERPVIVFVHRHPVDVADSLTARNGYHRPHGFALCEGVKPGARAAVGRPLLRPPPR